MYINCITLANVCTYMFQITKEGELLPFFQTELKVGGDGEEDKIFFIWPTTIVHKIDRYSPLYRISASDMLQERFEIVVILEGYKNVIFYWHIGVMIEIFNNVKMMINNIDRSDRIYRYDNTSEKFISAIRDSMGSSVPIHHFFSQRNRRIRSQLQSF